MFDEIQVSPPVALASIQHATEAIGFSMASDARTGSLLRTLAASKRKGAFLELGTGTGIATAWLLDGMDCESTLLTVDNDEAVVSVARKDLGNDPRVTFAVSDGAEYLQLLLAEGRQFDFVFADSWPGKYTHLEEALLLVKAGGMYVVDDMLPQANWPDDHPEKVAVLIERLLSHPDRYFSA
jgi:predicted O-methyltransferase YrrM